MRVHVYCFLNGALLRSVEALQLLQNAEAKAAAVKAAAEKTSAIESGADAATTGGVYERRAMLEGPV